MRATIVLVFVSLLALVAAGCSTGDAAPSRTAGDATPVLDEEPETTCTVNAECEPEQFCAKEPGDCEGDGTCATRPEICTQQWDPVCGCDDQTYGNACDAAANGENVAYEGECGEQAG